MPRPSRFDNRPHTLIDAKEACERLDVKRATLYTYVSRGLIRRVEGASARDRRYLAEDVERVRARAAARRGHEAVAAGALSFGDPVLDTRLSSAGPERLLYRGQDAVALATDGARLEEVAELLWGAEAAPWSSPKVSLRADERRASFPWRMARLLPRLALEDPDRAVAGGRDVDRAKLLVGVFAAASGLVSGRRGAGGTSAGRAGVRSGLASTVCHRLDLPPSAVPAVEAALVLVADHELNISTFSARVAASGGADLYACLGAALYTFTGPRHGGAAARADAWLERLGGGSPLRARLRADLSRGEPTPGFGHPIYPRGDPRAPPILAWARRLAPRTPDPLRRLLRAAEVMEEAGPHPLNLDGALLALAYAVGRPPEMASLLFCVGRSVGWMAHVFEQRASPELLRPRARYVGPGADLDGIGPSV